MTRNSSDETNPSFSGDPTNKQSELEDLWQGIRDGDARSARLLIERLIVEGDDESVQIAHHAIIRYFQRQTQSLIRQARFAHGESKRALTDEAIRAFTKALVAERLPQLTQESLLSAAAVPSEMPGLLPPTNLHAFGIDNGVTLNWVPPADPSLIGTIVTVYSDGKKLKDSTPLAPNVTTYDVTGLTNEKSYLFVLEARTQLLSSTANITAMAGLFNLNLLAPVKLSGVGIINGITFSWEKPTLSSGISITTYLLTLSGNDLTQTVEVAALSSDEAGESVQVTQSHTFSGLKNNALYQLTIQSLGTVAPLTKEQFGHSAGLTAMAGLPTTPFVPVLPQLPADPLVFLDTNLHADILKSERLLTQANAIGQKWHYEYLKEQAERSARDTLAYDRQIMDLMFMTLTKGAAAGSLSTSIFLAAIRELREDQLRVSRASQAVPVVKAVEELGDAVAAELIIAAVLRWLVLTDAFEFWRDFFDSLMGDVSAADTSLKRVKKFFDSQYVEGAFGLAVRGLANTERDRLGAEVANFLQPLRDAVAQLAGSVSEKLAEVFESFDLPLLMSPAPDGELLPNVNPFVKDINALEEAIVQLGRDLQKQVEETLLQVVNGEAKKLFRDLMITYLVTPLIVILAVSVAGGPAAAALLAGVVVVAAKQLLHLIARWLLGPLSEVLDQLDQDVRNAASNLQRALSYEVPTSSLIDLVSTLDLLEGELRQLRELMPQAFLDDLANLLAEARDVTLSGGIVHALAAERALGLTNATAFDRVRYAYESYFTPAGQMPRGTDHALFAGAGLMRDLNLLEQDMVRLTDNKEVEITRRLSLFQLLGGIGNPLTAADMALGRFADFLRSGQAIIDLLPEALLDDSTPGVYRALIKDVKVFGISKAPVIDSLLFTTGLAVTLTHSGESWTRIKRDSNPAAPPFTLPTDFPERGAYVLATAYRRDLTQPTVPLSPNSIEGKVWLIIAGLELEERTWPSIKKACLGQLPRAVGELGNICTAARARATALNESPGHGPANAIDNDRKTYYSSQYYSRPTPFPAPWLTVELDISSDTNSELDQTLPVITGVWLWPREGGKGFPISLQLEVSTTGIDDDDYRKIESYSHAVVDALGREAHYYHFTPLSARFIKITGKRMSGAGKEYYLQFSNVQIEMMNGAFVFVPLNPNGATGQPVDSSHPASYLVDRKLDTYFSSVRDPKFFAKFDTAFDSPQAINRIRIYPRQDRDNIFPTFFGLSLVSAKGIWSYTYRDYFIRGHDAQDFYVPTVIVRSIGLTGFGLSTVDDALVLQIAEVVPSVFVPNQSLINSALIESAVETILREMQWPTEGPVDPEEVAILVAKNLIEGVPGSGIPGLAKVAGIAWDTTHDEFLGRIAKWGDATQVEDPDPNVRTLRYVNLVRKVAPEAVTFDLFPVENALLQSGAYLMPRALGGETGSMQYRPFENLGVGGQIQIDVPQAASALLADLFIEITMRGCYDPDLASTVRAGQQQRDYQLARLSDTEQSAGRVLSPGNAKIGLASAELRTVQFSLRTQRDRILQAAVAGAQVKNNTTAPISESVTIDEIVFTPSQAKPLRATDAFSFFPDVSQALPSTISLTFIRDAAQTKLKDQLTEIVITPATLGVDLGLLSPTAGLPPLNNQAMPALVGIAVVIIPTRQGEPNLQPTVGTIDEHLRLLLGWKVGQTPIPRLSMTSPANAESRKISFSDLWPSSPGGSRKLQLNFGAAITEGSLYDVIFSLSFHTPLLAGVTTSPDLF